MLTKTKFLFATLVGALSLSAFAQDAATEDKGPWSAVVDLKAVEVSLNGEKLQSVVYGNVSYEFANKDSFTVEHRTDLVWRADDKNDFTGKFQYIRLPYKQKNVATLGNFNLDLVYRYTVPARADYQKQGALGQFLFRPELTGNFGSFKLQFLSGTGFYMQRKQYNVNYKTKEDAEGNPFFVWVPQAVFTWNAGAGFSLVADLSTTLIYVAKGRQDVVNKPKTYWVKEFDQEYVVNYSNPALGGFDLYTGVSHNSKYYTDGLGKKYDFKFFSKAATVFLGTSKAF